MNIFDPGFRVARALSLSENEVQLWRVDISKLAIGLDRWHLLLSSDEQERARRFLSLPAREQFVVTRGVLRTVLAAYLAGDPKRLIFHYSANKKPALGPPFDNSGVRFNVSHAMGVALLAFSRRLELGVDVESVDRQLEFDTISRQFFSRQEQIQLDAVAPEEKPAAFFRCWTRKEAYIKARGEGLSIPLADFDVSLASGDTNALISTRPDSSEGARWSLREVPAGSGYVAALCVAGHDWYLRCRQQDTELE
jgi:4'-phosphopantetheinyl transferase